jgi:hypothetical protein
MLISRRMDKPQCKDRCHCWCCVSRNPRMGVGKVVVALLQDQAACANAAEGQGAKD